MIICKCKKKNILSHILIMNKLLSYLVVILVGALYIASTMGYGVHNCEKDGTQNVVLLFGDNSCEALHSHIDGNGNIYSHKHEQGHNHTGCCNEHDENCCKTIVYTVSTDQVITNQEDSLDLSFFVDCSFINAFYLSSISLLYSDDAIDNDSFKYKRLGIPNVCNPIFILNRTIII